MLPSHETSLYTDEGVTTCTPESYAKSLGANVQFLLSRTRSYGFPTRASTTMFESWLKERHYATTLVYVGPNLEVHYKAPSGFSNIHILTLNK